MHAITHIPHAHVAKPTRYSPTEWIIIVPGGRWAYAISIANLSLLPTLPTSLRASSAASATAVVAAFRFDLSSLLSSTPLGLSRRLVSPHFIWPHLSLSRFLFFSLCCPTRYSFSLNFFVLYFSIALDLFFLFLPAFVVPCFCFPPLPFTMSNSISFNNIVSFFLAWIVHTFTHSPISLRLPWGICASKFEIFDVSFLSFFLLRTFFFFSSLPCVCDSRTLLGSLFLFSPHFLFLVRHLSSFSLFPVRSLFADSLRVPYPHWQ